jgi:hypothetical protein
LWITNCGLVFEFIKYTKSKKLQIGMIMMKCIFVIAVYSAVFFANRPFMGNVLDKDYVKKNKFTQIVKTDSSEATQGMVWTTVYKFNAEGWVIEKKEEGKETLTTVYTYDKNSNLTESNTRRADGSLYVSEKMVYDMNNRLQESVIRKVVEKVTISDKIEWVDENTRHTTRVVNGTTSRFLNAFDDKKHLIDETFESGKGVTWVYDGDLLLMQKQKGGAPNIERYEYDDQQRVSLIENNYSRKSFNYDGAGRLISTNKKDENERTIAWERYEYAPSSY